MKFYDLYLKFNFEDPSEKDYYKVFPHPFFSKDIKIERVCFKDIEPNKLYKNSIIVPMDYYLNIRYLSKIRDKNNTYIGLIGREIINDVKNNNKLNKIKFFLRGIRAYKIPFIVMSGANSFEETRTPKEWAILFEFLGLTQKLVMESMSKNAEKYLRDRGIIDGC